MKNYLALFLSAVVLFSPLASVEAKATSELQKTIDQLQLQIKQLQGRAALTSAQSTGNPNLSITSFDDKKDGKPKIKITTHTTKKNKFNKTIPGDPILISWTAYNVPENTNLTIDLNTVKIKGSLGGGSAQFALPEGDSKGTYKWDIYGAGRASAGTYRVQLGLEECSSLGCHMNAHFPGQEEDVELYAQSRSVGVKVIEKTVKPSLSEEKSILTNKSNSVATMTTNRGVIEMELFEDTMPITTGNFIKLADKGFFNQTKFHRVIEGFMIQGGDPTTKKADTTKYGTGGPGYSIPDEFVKGKYLSNVRGSVAMANSGPNSGGSQFFINLVDNTGLDYDKPPTTSSHPVFGRVVKGLAIVDMISKVDTDSRDMPSDPVIVTKIDIK